MVWKHQIQTKNSAPNKATKPKVSPGDMCHNTVTREENKFYFFRRHSESIKPKENDKRSPHINVDYKIECVPKLFMRCQCRIIFWLETL